ncbi:co-chaperone GroES [Treponema sp. R6D11]
MKFEPNGDRYLVKFCEDTSETKSGILLASSAQEKPQFAEVVAAGDGNTDDKKIEMKYKIGDKVSVGRYAGNEIKLDDEEFVIVKQDEILGRLK